MTIHFKMTVIEQSRHTRIMVLAHHQNGITESKKKILSYGCRKILLHTRIISPNNIKASLWQFSLLAETKRKNEFSLDNNGNSPLDKFTRIEAKIICKEFHTWGCPVFILDDKHQSGMTGTPKWEAKARAEIYLGYSQLTPEIYP